ncbi:MAG: hypothetical protein H6845_00340 [Alphaproteobacteria bacterium]|nr:MAG: hypothetical protein H6845_00340 [Alphaproteobacteria bacterium]
MQDQNGNTALMYAVKGQHLMRMSNTTHLDMITVLLKAGADLNLKNAGGKTALMLATENQKANVINLIHQHSEE